MAHHLLYIFRLRVFSVFLIRREKRRRPSKGRSEEAKIIWGRLVDYNSDPIHGVDIICDYKPFGDGRACDSLGDFDW